MLVGFAFLALVQCPSPMATESGDFCDSLFLPLQDRYSATSMSPTPRGEDRKGCTEMGRGLASLGVGSHRNAEPTSTDSSPPQ